jgi:integrase
MGMETATARLIQDINKNKKTKEIGMSIISRGRKDGTTAHQVILRPLGGKTITKTFDDLDSAKMFEELTEQEMASTQLRRALAFRMTKGFKDFAMTAVIPEGSIDPKLAQSNYDAELLEDTLAAFMKSKDCANKARAGIPSVIKTVGKVRLGELKKRWVRQYIDHLRSVPTQFGEPYAYATIQGYISMINCAVRWRAEEFDLEPVRLPFNKRTMFPRCSTKARTRRLEREEQLALFASLRKIQGSSNRHYRLLTLFALATGARLQEMVLADWSEFDLSIGTWSIPATHEKTGQGRCAPLTPRARRILKVLWSMRDATKPRVFHLLGKPQTVSSVFARVVSKAGLVDFHFHDLRHEAVTRMVLRQSISVEMIMQMVGHASLAMHRRYTNLRPAEMVGMLR